MLDWLVSTHPKAWLSIDTRMLLDGKENKFLITLTPRDHGSANSYRMGAEGKFDLKLAPSYEQQVLSINSGATSGKGPFTQATIYGPLL